MRAIVVGASGYLGSRLARRLIEEGWEVYGTWFKNEDRLPAGLAGSFQIDGVPTSGMKTPDTAFVCAAHIPYGAMKVSSSELMEANVRLPERYASCFPSARLVLASSVAVFGEAPSPRTESTPTAPSDAYGLSKLSAETAVLSHPSWAVVRLTSLYGPDMTAPTFLNAIVNDARSKRRIRILGDGRRTQDYLFVDDAADLLAAAARSPLNGVFLGATGVAVSNRRAAAVVATELPGTDIEYFGDDASPSVSYDPSRTFHDLGFSPAVSFEDGMRRMVRGE